MEKEQKRRRRRKAQSLTCLQPQSVFRKSRTPPTPTPTDSARPLNVLQKPLGQLQEGQGRDAQKEEEFPLEEFQIPHLLRVLPCLCLHPLRPPICLSAPSLPSPSLNQSTRSPPSELAGTSSLRKGAWMTTALPGLGSRANDQTKLDTLPGHGVRCLEKLSLPCSPWSGSREVGGSRGHSPGYLGPQWRGALYERDTAGATMGLGRPGFGERLQVYPQDEGLRTGILPPPPPKLPFLFLICPCIFRSSTTTFSS